jgi:hypothetical protein
LSEVPPAPRRRARDLARSAPAIGHPYDITESRTSTEASRLISEKGVQVAHYMQDVAAVKLRDASNQKAPASMRSLIFGAKDEATDVLRAAFTVGEPMVDLRPAGDTTTDVAILAMIEILNDKGESAWASEFEGERRDKMGSVAHASYILAAFDAFMDELVHLMVDLFVWVLGDEHAPEYLPRALEGRILIARTQVRHELRSWGLPA